MNTKNLINQLQNKKQINPSSTTKTKKVASLLACACLMFGLQACADTLSDIKTASTNYLNLASGQHATYSDLVTTKDDNHPDCVVIGGTRYFYKANESTQALTSALRNLASTGASAITEVTSSDNYIFSVGGKYYTYVANNLPTSIFTTSAGTSNNYTYKTTDSNQNDNYHLVTIDANKMSSNNKVTWTKSDSNGVSGYTWANTNVPLASNPNYVETDGNLASVDGAIRFSLLYNGSTQTQYYIYQYVNSLSNQASNARLDNLTSDISNAYFYNQNAPGGDTNELKYGGAIYNTSTDGYSITADFIKNTTSNSGGAIYNSGILTNIQGDYIGNSGSYGGAIYNYDGATINSIKGDFIKNSSTNNGGAIINCTNSNIGNIAGNFQGNTGNYGGGIYNYYGTIGSITSDFIANRGSYGGAIANYSGNINAITGDFIGNTSSQHGGAIYNAGKDKDNLANIGSITGDFLGNTGLDCGGIYNYYGTIGSITGDFIGNKSNQGGGIFNGSSSTIGIVTGDFISNTASRGGAIYLDGGYIQNISGNFIGNTASQTGGAIYNSSNIGSINGDFIGNKSLEYGAGAIYSSGHIETINGNFINNTSATSGGAICYEFVPYSSLAITGNFIGNQASTYGGAIAHVYYSSISSITGNFIENKAKYGGAIANFGSNGASINTITADFVNNVASSYGGAIYNDNSTIKTLTGNFNNNTASGAGGAIYNNGSIGLVANTQDILFSGNTDSTGYNDIYQYGGVTNLNAGSNKKITFSGSVRGSRVITNTLNINNSSNNAAVGGEYIFNNSVKEQNFNIYNGANVKISMASQDVNDLQNSSINNIRFYGTGSTLDIDMPTGQTFTTVGRITSDNGQTNTININNNSNSNLNGGNYGFYGRIANTNLNAYNKASITYAPQNGMVETSTIPTFTLDGAITLAIDASLSNSTVDTIVSENPNLQANSIIISSINICSASNDSNIDILLTDNSILKAAYTLSNNVDIVSKRIGYDVDSVSYNPLTGILTVNGTYTGDIEPAIVWEQISENDSSNYTFSDTNKLSNLVYREQYKRLRGVEGVVKKMNANGEIEYHKFTYTPSSAQVTASKLSNLTSDVPYSYFYNIAGINGGAIYNSSSNQYSIIADFIKNSATSNGGAIYNTGTLTNIQGNFIGNTANGSDGGGAIYNSGSSALIKNITGDFIGNTASNGSGGAIYKEGGTISKISGDFIGNTASGAGGAIYYHDGTISSITGDFIGNTAGTSGGSIYNSNGAIVNITGDFIGNSALNGNAGGIVNNGGTITTIKGNFTGNSSNNYPGGALANWNSGTIGSITGNFTNNTANNGAGGAIYNAGTISSITGDFIGNKSSKGGGSIYNSNGTIGNITGDFINNIALNGNAGGIVNNGGTITTIKGNFTGNSSNNYPGGALANWNSGTIGSITGNFTNNTANNAGGGAIYNAGTITLKADTQDILFDNNKAYTTSYNDIYQSAGTTNLNADANKKITFNGSIIGDSSKTNVLNVNNDTNSNPTGGKYIFNNTIANQNVNLNNGADVKFGSRVQGDGTTSYGRITKGSLTISGDNTTIDTQNNHVETFTPDTLTINSPITLAIDAKLSTATADTFNATTITAAENSIVINAINLITDSLSSNVDILLTNNATLKLAYTLSNDIMSNITKLSSVNYNVNSVTYDNQTGILSINGNHISSNPFSDTNHVIWQKVSENDVSGYTFNNDSKLSDINYNVTDNKLNGATGAVKYTNADGELEYYTFTYNNPKSDIESSTRLEQLYADVPISYFYNLNTTGNGGAVYNTSTNKFSITADFIKNSATNGGGAIYNTGTLTDIQGNFIGNKTTTKGGGAIYNTNSRAFINSITGDFIENTAQYGGAINSEGTILSITGDFIGNIATKEGGAIHNYNGTISTIKGNFIGNIDKSTNYGGGAIYNIGTLTNIQGDFNDNTSSNRGGAICNDRTIGSITGDFINNTAQNSGAISSEGTISSITGNFLGNKATNTCGGGLNNSGTIGTITGDFIENTAKTFAGAIRNSGTITSINGNFERNNAQTVGGGIYNFGPISILTGDFIGNTAGTYGGAIGNHTQNIGVLTGNFIGNTAGAYGGAISNGFVIDNSNKNGGTITLVADTDNINFVNNTDSTGYNDLYQRSGTTNLNAASGKSITFNGTISGANTNNININDATKNVAIGGEYIFNNTISNNNVNLYDGANVKFGTTTQQDGSTSYGAMTSGNLNVLGTNAQISTQNTIIDTVQISKLTVNNPVKLAIDASLSNKNDMTPSADKINTTLSGLTTDSIIISAINILTSTTEKETNIQLTENSVLKAAYTLSNDILKNITVADGIEYYVKSVSYNNETGVLTLNGSNKTNNADNAQLEVTLPDYLHIEQASIVPSATASIQNATTLSLDVSPSVTYNVYSNYSTKLYVTATSPTGETSSKSLFGIGTDDMTIVFTNSNGNASSANIENCLGASPDYNDNANAIAFKLNCATPVMTTGTTAASVAVNNNNVEYDVHSGMTTLGFSVAQSANAGTFFSNDPTGTYKATLTISNVAP